MHEMYGKVAVKEDRIRRFELSWKTTGFRGDELEAFIARAKAPGAPDALKYELAMSFGRTIAGFANRYSDGDANFFQYLCNVGADLIVPVLSSYSQGGNFLGYFCKALSVRFNEERKAFLNGWSRNFAKVVMKHERKLGKLMPDAIFSETQASVIAAQTGVQEENVRKVQQLANPVVSLDLLGSDGFLVDDTLLDNVGSDPEIDNERDDLSDRIRNVCEKLSVKQRIILRQMYGVDLGPFSKKAFCEGLHFKQFGDGGGREYTLEEVEEIVDEFREKVRAFCVKPEIRVSAACLQELSSACRSKRSFEKFLKSDLKEDVTDVLYGIMWPKEMIMYEKYHKEQDEAAYVDHMRKAVVLSSIFNIPPITEFPTKTFAERALNISREAMMLCARNAYPILRKQLGEYRDSVRNPRKCKDK